MKMAKAGITGKTPAEKGALSKVVEAAMTANPNFVTPVPTVAELAAGRTDLENAMVAAAGGDHDRIVERNKAERALDTLLVRLSLYVSNVAQGDEVIILSSGFEVRRPSEPIGQPGVPENLRAEMGAQPGSTDLRWTPVRGAYIYQVEMTTTDPSNAADWKLVDECSTASYTVEGLTPATYHWFRVRAIGAYPEYGLYSDPAKGFTTPLP